MTSFPGLTEGAEATETRPSFMDLLDAETANRLLSTGRTRSFPPRSVIFSENNEAREVYVITEGAVKVGVVLAGREIVLDVLGPGELLGELSAIENRPRSADAATLNSVDALMIPTATFIDFLTENPPASVAMLQYISARLREASQRQIEYGALDAIGRVCRRLVEMTDRYGRPSGTEVVMDMQLTQHDMAAWAGLSREAVVKALRAMRTLGWIRTSDGAITIVDDRSVRARAETELR